MADESDASRLTESEEDPDDVVDDGSDLVGRIPKPSSPFTLCACALPTSAAGPV